DVSLRDHGPFGIAAVATSGPGGGRWQPNHPVAKRDDDHRDRAPRAEGGGLTDATRVERIAYWWEDVAGAPWFDVTASTEARLEAAFAAVLAALSEAEAEGFFFRGPAVICVEHARGKSFRFPLPATCVWLDADAVRGDPDVDFLVAHEVAHV